MWPHLEIMQRLVDGSHNMDSALQQYLEGQEEGRLSRLLVIFDCHKDDHDVLDQILMHTWKYIENNPTEWQHRYKSLEQLKADIRYVDTVFLCFGRRTESMKRLHRENLNVLKHWKVRCLWGVSNIVGTNLERI
jgi:hypothetical protein